MIFCKVWAPYQEESYKQKWYDSFCNFKDLTMIFSKMHIDCSKRKEKLLALLRTSFFMKDDDHCYEKDQERHTSPISFKNCHRKEILWHYPDIRLYLLFFKISSFIVGNQDRLNELVRIASVFQIVNCNIWNCIFCPRPHASSQIVDLSNCLFFFSWSFCVFPSM